MPGEESVTELEPVKVYIELTRESENMLKELQTKIGYLRQYDVHWLVNHAVHKYHEKKMDDDVYSHYRKTQIRKRLSYQSWMCYWDWCKRPLTPETATLDHLIPLSRGGKSEGSNLVVSCTFCNGEKGEMDEEEYSKFKLIRPMYESRTEEVRGGDSGEEEPGETHEEPSDVEQIPLNTISHDLIGEDGKPLKSIVRVDGI